MLEFLCECGSVQPVHGLLFKPQEVRRKLLLLVEQMDFSKALHLNMVGSSKFGGSPWQSFSQKHSSYLVFLQYLILLKKLPAEDSLSPEEFDSLLRPLAYENLSLSLTRIC